MVNVNGVLNHYDHSGHVAVVTGGTKGIGLGIAKSLLAGGAKVVLAGRDEHTGKTVLEDVDAGDAAHFVATDVTSQQSCEALIDEAVERYGFLDILVNNAGGRGQVPQDRRSSRCRRCRTTGLPSAPSMRSRDHSARRSARSV